MQQKQAFTAAAVLLLVTFVGCGGKPAGDSATTPLERDPKANTRPAPEKPEPKFELLSPTILHRGAVPATFTCDGEGTSPELSWNQPPEGTKSLVMIVTDPDVPKNFTHWLVYDIPVETQKLRATLPADPVLADAGGAKQGKNDFGKIGWGALCPPAGMSHRYVFRLYAVDAMLDLPPGVDRAALEKAIEGHFQGQSALIASYTRKP